MAIESEAGAVVAPSPGRGVPRGTRFFILRLLLGLLLLTAAGFKAHQLATEPMAQEGWLTSRWFLIAVVVAQLLLGFLLLCGPYPRALWWAALGCFSAMGAVSLWYALAGEVSCGCFGKVQVNPWYTVALNAACLFMLLICRPGPSGVQRGAWGSRARLAASLLLALAAGIPAVWLTRGGGLMLVREPPLLYEWGELVTGTVPIRNHGSAPVRVASTQSTQCHCIDVEVEPADLEPGETGSLSYKFRVMTFKPGQRISLRFIATTEDGRSIPIDGEVRFDVRESFTFTPRSICVVGDVAPGSPFETLLKVSSVGALTPEMLACSFDKVEPAGHDPGLAATVVAGDNPNTVLVRVTGTAPVTPGKFQANLELDITDGDWVKHRYTFFLTGRAAGPETVKKTAKSGER